MISLRLVGIAVFTVAGLSSPLVLAESLGTGRFAGTVVTIYKNEGGRPGGFDKKIPVSSLQLPSVQLMEWDDKTKMMLVNFAQGDVGWVRKKDIVPPPGECKTTDKAPDKAPDLRVAMAQGSNTNRQVLSSRGLIEKACQ